MLSNNIKQPSRLLNLPRFEYSVGYFCSKVQSAASSAQIAYLNKIIHILLSIPADLKRNHAQDESYQ